MGIGCMYMVVTVIMWVIMAVVMMLHGLTLEAA